MPVTILDGCIVCRVCSSINSDVLEFDEDHINVHEEYVKGNEIDCIDAAVNCPVNVIQIEE